MTESPDIKMLSDKGPDGAGEEGSKDTDFYFQYYSSLQSQANMLGDTARTEAYRRAILGNAKVAFQGKQVMDLGAGSGILSYMAAQAGAEQVVAVEASSMAEKMSQLISLSEQSDLNPHLRSIRVVRGKIETPSTQAEISSHLSGDGEADCKVDTIVSEPIGVLLFHERMVESFLMARDLYLKPNGTLYPCSGKLWFVPLEDKALWTETETKASFFNQRLFGTDFSPLLDAAREEVFSQPVVGPINPATLFGEAECPRNFDFYTLTQKELEKFEVEVEWDVSKVGLIHGIASWFDLSFLPPRGTEPLSSSPENDENSENELLRAAWAAVPTPAEMAQQAAVYSYYGTGGENVLDPPELPEAPEDGWEVELDTGPFAQRTHWQQCRLLLSEPLAVNRGSRVHATITFTAHESRSYYIDLDMWVVPENNINGMEQHVDERTRRRMRWNLAQQTLNYSYAEESAVAGQAAAAWKGVTSAYS
ncbi:hypothetical protein FFLO_01846 [Filobasidium floriforme]|uniref:type I protein arginine methyltransferase n=1 Tax=Filobasidium floriforme TaxID=5210 RepID=A0A8K0JP22_9TREE|nr:hypothetical protein FFLO_01846 [Filobasidium floriforme]